MKRHRAMRWLKLFRADSRRIAILAVGGLLAAIAIAGVVGLLLNQRVKETTKEALQHEIELESQANELRGAILNVNHNHRNLVMIGPSQARIDNFEETYALLQEEIDRLEELGVQDPQAPQPDQVRQMAESYYASFRPAIDEFNSDPEEFARASDLGLVQLAELERSAQEIQRLNKERLTAALDTVAAANDTGRTVLLTTIAGLFLIGVTLAYATVRTVSELRKLYAREKKAAEELAESEELFRLLAENAQDMIYRLQLAPAPKFEYVSPSVEVITGYTPKEYYADPELWFNQIHPEDRHLLEASIPSPEVPLLLRWYRKDGRLIWIEQRNKPIYDETGDLVALEGIGRDVTETKRVEELRRAVERLDSTLTSITDAYFALDEEWRFLEVNRVAEKTIFRKPAGELIGKVFWEEYPQAVHNEFHKQYVAALKDRQPVHFEARSSIVGRWFEAHAYPREERLEIYLRDITERKRAEEALRRSEAGLAEAQRIAHLGSWEWYVQPGELIWTDETFRIYGYEPNQIVPSFERFIETAHPDDRELLLEAHDKALHEGWPYDFEHRIVRRDGEERIVHRQGKVDFDENGELLRMAGTIHDITERKRVEEALRRSKQRLSRMVETAKVGIAFADSNGRVFEANEALLQMLGRTRAEMVEEGLNWQAFTPPEYQETQRQRIEELIRTGVVGPAEKELIRKDGTRVPVLVSATRLEGEQDEYVRFVLDLTERKQVEEALRQSEAHYAAVVDTAFDAIVTVAANGTIQFFNPGAERIFGYTAQEAIGHPVTLLLPERFRKLHKAGLNRYLRTGQARAVGQRMLELVGQRKDGEEFPLELSIAVVREGEAVLFTGIMRDITDRKRIEEELARSLQSKMDFLADVSHELRTPLTMIRTNAEVGLEIERNCTHTRLLKEIAKGSARMSRLIEDLLFLARSDSHSPPLELEPVEVPLFLAEVVKHAEALARERGATFEARLTGEGRLRIDPARIEQAILILVDNAAKYSPVGSLVTLASTTGDDELCVSVQDTGPGIAKADLPHIFERFYRGKKRRTDDGSQGGIGLGLAIARAIAEAHSGRIEAASQLGEGTRMSLYLPLTSTLRPANQETLTNNGEKRPKPVFS